MGHSNLPPGVTQAMIDEHFRSTCRSCGEELAEEDFEAGRCPHCGEDPDEYPGPDPDEAYEDYRDRRDS